MTAAYLAKLNAEQRRAVEHGCAALDEAPPLLIIAGAGSGKTNTLANRVAHLIVSGADPRRIMLLTFSRRAAAEMQRRVERITAEVLGAKAGPMAHALNWSGTFHAIGARLLREYSLDIGLSNTFTIHDREDSADLMNLVRHDLGFSKTDKRFPMKGTCLSIYSRAVNAEAPLDEVLGSFFPWCAEWEAELRTLFGAYVEAKQKQNVLDYDDLLLYWAQMMVEGAVAQDVADRFDHVLVDEYQDTNRLQASILLGSQTERARVDRRRRRRAVDLFLPGGDGAKHSRLPGPFQPKGRNHHAGAELPLDAADPRRGQCRHRSCIRAFHEKPVVGPRVGGASISRQCGG